MLLNKEILVGLYGGSKTNIDFNIGWNTNNVTVTAYDPQVNENDLPRINTWKSNDTYITYMSAGNQVFDFNTKTFSTPWGNRSQGAETITIPLRTSDTAGVDLYVDDRQPLPVLTPNVAQWTVTNTVNPNEKRYRYSVPRFADKTQNIDIIMFEGGFWTFNYNVNTNLYNFSSSVSNTNNNIEIFWGDGQQDTIASGATITHSYLT
jgi:uncharacterized GH25 family protein